MALREMRAPTQTPGPKKDLGLKAEREIGNKNAHNVSGPSIGDVSDLISGRERKTNASYNVLGSEGNA